LDMYFLAAPINYPIINDRVTGTRLFGAATYVNGKRIKRPIGFVDVEN